MKYISANMYSVLQEVCTRKRIPVQNLHTLTVAALMARGAVYLDSRKGTPGVDVRASIAGGNLLSWASNAKFQPYKKTRPVVHDAKLSSKE